MQVSFPKVPSSSVEFDVTGDDDRGVTRSGELL